jgi:hypothetical protein
MAESEYFENVGRLKGRLKIVADQILDKTQSGALPVAMDASGCFAQPAKRQINGKYLPVGEARHCENEFLYVARKYLIEFDRTDAVEMGLACTKPGAEADQIVSLKGGIHKPTLRLHELYVPRRVAEKLFVSNTPDQLRRAEGIEAAKELLRAKFGEGKLKNEDDYGKWMTNANVIRHIRANPGKYPHCAKIKPKKQEGTTKEREPTLTKSFVGLLDDVSTRDEYRRLTDG